MCGGRAIIALPPDVVLSGGAPWHGLDHRPGHFLRRVAGVDGVAVLRCVVADARHALIIGRGVVGAAVALHVVQRIADIPAQAVQIVGDGLRGGFYAPGRYADITAAAAGGPCGNFFHCYSPFGDPGNAGAMVLFIGGFCYALLDCLHYTLIILSCQ